MPRCSTTQNQIVLTMVTQQSTRTFRLRMRSSLSHGRENAVRSWWRKTATVVPATFARGSRTRGHHGVPVFVRPLVLRRNKNTLCPVNLPPWPAAVAGGEALDWRMVIFYCWTKDESTWNGTVLDVSNLIHLLTDSKLVSKMESFGVQ